MGRSNYSKVLEEKEVINSRWSSGVEAMIWLAQVFNTDFQALFKSTRGQAVFDFI